MYSFGTAGVKGKVGERKLGTHARVRGGKMGRIELLLDPYHHEDADAEFRDVLFFWEEMDSARF